MAKKMDIGKDLFVACQLSETQFMARSLRGWLRFRLAELATLIQALKFPPAVVDAKKDKTTEVKKS